MYNFLIGGKTGLRPTLSTTIPCVATSARCRRASLAPDHHLIEVTTPNCTQNERNSHGHSSDAKSL